MLNGIYTCICLYYILSVNWSRTDCSLCEEGVNRRCDCTCRVHCNYSECHRQVCWWKGVTIVLINRETAVVESRIIIARAGCALRERVLKYNNRSFARE